MIRYLVTLATSWPYTLITLPLCAVLIVWFIGDYRERRWFG